jgi:hypothetical protein
MSQMSLLSAFNNILDQFLQDLVLTFPELKDLRTIQTLVAMLRRVNPRMALDNFLSVAGRYHQKILARDSTFFENLDNWKTDPYFQSEFASGQTEVFQRLVVFKDVWVDLTESNRETIWTYFRQLLIIGSKANKNPELVDISKKILDAAAAAA